MKKTIPLLLLFFHFSCLLFSQGFSVSGTVTSAEDEEGLPGVSVVIRGTSKGTISDINGDFILGGVARGDTLLFSYIGFEPQKVAVGDQKEFLIVMKPTAENLDEVIVTALGVKRQKRDIGYSTERIDADVIVQSNTPNVIQAIIGRPCCS